VAGRAVEPDREVILAWVERIAVYLSEQDNVPLIAGRILGWLTICEPPEQTAAEIAEAIGASRASLTTNLRLLASTGFLEKSTRPGQPAVYYRIDDAAWGRVLERQAASLTALGEITRDGLRLAGGARAARAARVRTANEAVRWLERLFADAPPPPWTPKKGY
jgi:DNA-binding MarR family transcriptional regulator